jgi:hypothetical protein
MHLTEIAFCLGEFLKGRRGDSPLLPKCADAYLKGETVYFGSLRKALNLSPITWSLGGSVQSNSPAALGKALGEALEEYAFYDGFDFRSRAKANGRLLMSRMGYVDTRIFHKEVKAVVATYDGKCLEFLPTAPAGEEWNFLAETLKTEASSQSELGENLLQAFSLCRPNWPFEPQS